MTAKLSLFVIFGLGYSMACAQQMSASALRAKYGEPLARETFQVRPNIEAVVNYGPRRQVCNIEIPQTTTKREVDEVVDELAPPSARGKKVGQNLMVSGKFTEAVFSYELITISEPQDPDHPGRRTAVRITFNRTDCQ